MNVRCVSCEKTTAYPDNEAGMLAICPACGVSFRLPTTPPPEPVAQPPEPAAELPVAAAPLPEPAVQPPIPLPPVVVDPTASDVPARHFPWGAVALWTSIVLIACGTGVGGWWYIQKWDHQRQAQTLAHATQLRDQAESLLGDGKIDQAQAKYADLESFVVGSSRADLKRMSDEVRHDITERRAHPFAFAPSPTTKPTVASPVALATVPKVADPFEELDKDPAATIPSPAPVEVAAAPGPPPVEVAVASPTRPPVTIEVPKPPEPAKVESRTQPPAAAVPTSSTNRPVARKLAEPSDVLTDEKIGAAITRGIDELIPKFDPKTYLLHSATDRESVAIGLDILCVYALMQCQQATDDPRLNPHGPFMIGLIEAMKHLNLDTYNYETYARGLRATALALYNRPEDREVLKKDADALVKGSHGGGYTYRVSRGGGGFRNDAMDHWDNSNSQYGLLGVWSAAEVGYEVPEAYWALVQKHWQSCELGDWSWGYSPRRMDEGTHSMTCAAVASLFVTHDYLDVPKFGTDVGRDPFTPPLMKGINWLERGANSVELNRGAYDLYGLERVGLASGFKFFGTHEWYRELAARTIAMEARRGQWNGDVETAYSLLFLARGRHPILMNKVRFDGFWANRPRNVANLARFAGYQLERPLNWQVVPLARNWTDWMDSPILYLASHKAIRMSDANYEKIRSFVDNGGLLFMQSDGSSAEFDKFAHEAAHKLFPTYEMTQLPPNHPLCNVMYKIKPGEAHQIVSNGSRILIVYSGQDLSKSWQLRDNKNKPFPFEFGTNMFIYAAGKRELRNHLTSNVIADVTATPSATYSIARLSYNGNWDPEPAAWHRFGNWFQLNSGYKLNVKTVAIKDLTPEVAPIAELTGTARYDLTNDEAAAIKRYVEAGGTLLVDVCGGSGPFDQSMQSSLYFKAFGNSPSHVMSPLHPLLKGVGNGMEDLSKPKLRQFAIDELGPHAGLPEEISAGKGHVIYTSLDLTSGLLGTNTWGILGYDPQYAQSLVKNVILWTIDGAHEETPLANR